MNEIIVTPISGVFEVREKNPEEDKWGRLYLRNEVSRNFLTIRSVMVRGIDNKNHPQANPTRGLVEKVDLTRVAGKRVFSQFAQMPRVSDHQFTAKKLRRDDLPHNLLHRVTHSGGKS